jgi:hypothetical protein
MLAKILQEFYRWKSSFYLLTGYDSAYSLNFVDSICHWEEMGKDIVNPAVACSL